MRLVWLLRILFVFTALVALGFLFSPPRRLAGPERVQQVLVGAGLLVWSIGLLLPWGRWIRLVSPGENLGLFTRIVGWAGACGLPVAIAAGDLLVALFCAVVPVAALGMWRQRPWAVWVWSALIACGLVLNLVRFVRVAWGDDPELQGNFDIVWELLRVVFNSLLLLVFVGTVRRWGLSLRPTAAAERAPSAG